MRQTSDNTNGTQWTTNGMAPTGQSLSDLQRIRMYHAQLQYNRLAASPIPRNDMSQRVLSTTVNYQVNAPTDPSYGSLPYDMGSYRSQLCTPSTVSQQTSETTNMAGPQRTEQTVNNNNEEAFKLRQQLLLEVLSQIDNEKRAVHPEKRAELPSRKLNSGGGVAFDWSKMPRIGSVHSVHGIVESNPVVNNSVTNTTKSPPSPPKDSSPAETPSNSMSKMKISELAKLILSGTFDGLLDNTVDKDKPASNTPYSPNNSNNQSTITAPGSQANNPGASRQPKQILNDQQLTVLADKIIGSYKEQYALANAPYNQTPYNHQAYSRTNQSYVGNASAGRLNTTRNVGNTYDFNNNSVTSVNQRTNVVNQGGMAAVNQRGQVYQNRTNHSVNYRHLSEYQRNINLNQSYPTANQVAAYRQPSNSISQSHMRRNSVGHVRRNSEGHVRRNSEDHVRGNSGHVTDNREGLAMPVSQSRVISAQRDVVSQDALRDVNLAHFARYLPSQRQTRTATVHPRIVSVFSTSRQGTTNTLTPSTSTPTMSDVRSESDHVNHRLLLDDTHDSLACIDCLLLGTCPIKKSIDAAKAKTTGLEDKDDDGDDVVITKVTTKDAEKGSIERIDVDEWVESAPVLPERVKVKQEPIDDSHEGSTCRNGSGHANAASQQSNESTDKTSHKSSLESSAQISHSTTNAQERAIDNAKETVATSQRGVISSDTNPPNQDDSVSKNKRGHPVEETPVDFSVLVELDNSSLSKMSDLKNKLPAYVKSPLDLVVFAEFNESPSQIKDKIDKNKLSSNGETPVDFSALTEIDVSDAAKLNSTSQSIAEHESSETSEELPIHRSEQLVGKPNLQRKENDLRSLNAIVSRSSITDEQTKATEMADRQPPIPVITENNNEGDGIDQNKLSRENSEPVTSPELQRTDGVIDEEQEEEHRTLPENTTEMQRGKESTDENKNSDPSQRSYEQALLHVMSPLDKISYLKLQKSLEDNQKKLNKQTILWIRKHILRARLSFTKKLDRLRDKYKAEAVDQMEKMKQKSEHSTSDASQQMHTETASSAAVEKANYQESGPTGARKPNTNQGIEGTSSKSNIQESNINERNVSNIRVEKDESGHLMTSEEMNSYGQQPTTLDNAVNNIQNPITNSTKGLNTKREEVEAEGHQSSTTPTATVFEKDVPMTLEEAIKSLDNLVPGQDTAATWSTHGGGGSSSSNNTYINSETSDSRKTSSSFVCSNSSNNKGSSSTNTNISNDNQKLGLNDNTNILTGLGGSEPTANQNTDPPSNTQEVFSPIFERRTSLSLSETSTSNQDQNIAENSSYRNDVIIDGLKDDWHNENDIVERKKDMFVPSVHRKRNIMLNSNKEFDINYTEQNSLDINRNITPDDQDTSISNIDENNYNTSKANNTNTVNETIKELADKSSPKPLHQRSNFDLLDSLPEQLFADDHLEEQKKSPAKRRSTEGSEHEEPKKTKRDEDKAETSNIWELWQSKYSFD